MLEFEQKAPLRRRGSRLCSAAAALVLAGCGTTSFADATPLVVLGPPKPPPAAPEPTSSRVQVKADRIEITEKIQFDIDKATIKSESHGLLDEIVSVIRANPQIRGISIEGHTDSVGDPRYNQGLSERRAAAVLQYLVEHGIAEGVLTSQGFGLSRPIASNDSRVGKEANRRVEFVITVQDDVIKTVEIDAKTGKERVVDKTIAARAPAQSSAAQSSTAQSSAAPSSDAKELQ